MASTATPSCPRCQIGHLQVGSATYSCVQQGVFLSVPNVPSWTCDICQYREFDFDALIRIEALVGQLGPASDADLQTAKRPPVDNEVIDKRPPRIKP
ncbi:MAG: hypothetical protein IAE80_28875 [Anaerolinea sp.]|nr:hypothetical protein [Anaerolinea sp.]